ncbi:MAG: acyl-CoA reductase, partial [Myxococcota bacterium]|nr:acyl-CoA reductase [Myxococcota bacterium]
AAAQLVAVGQVLRSLSVEERINGLVRWAAAWCSPTDPYRRAALEQLPAVTGLSREMVARGIDVAFESVEAHRLHQWWEREGAQGSGGAMSAHIWSSNVFVAGLPPVLASLLAGIPCLIKAPEGKPDFAVLLARSWADRDLLVGPCLAAASWSRDRHNLTDALLLKAGSVVVFGEDRTVDSIRKRVDALPCDPPVLGFGHRLSIAALGPELLPDPEALERAVEGLAWDSLAWDGAGCLTPRWIFVEGGPAEAERLARLAAPLVAKVAKDLPPAAPLDAGSGAERAAWLGRAGFEGWSAQGRGWAVASLAEARLDPLPPPRCLAFLPVEDFGSLSSVLAPLGARLQGLAYGGEGARRASLSELLRPLGLSIAVQPGMLQRPPVDWNHDDVRILESFC